MDAFIILIVLSFIILLGAFGELFFRKTGIPDVLWLMTFGIIIGFFFNFANSSVMNSVLPIFVVLTLIIILFDGGLNLKLGSLVKNSIPGVSLATVYLILSILFITGLTYLLHVVGILPNWNLWSGIVLGAILGGTSSVIVIPLVVLAGLEEKIQEILSVESAFNDALCIVVVFTLLDYLQNAGQSSLGIIFKNIAASFAIGIVLGIVIGLVWLYVLKKFSSEKTTEQYFYVFSLALLILLYVFTEYLGGSSAIAIFIFGLIMGSSELINRIFNIELYVISEDIHLINRQIAFLIKSFFFVLIGLMFVFVLKSFLIALGIILILVLARYLSVLSVGTTRNLLINERKLLYYFAPKGLAAGLLAIAISTNTVLLGASEVVNIVFATIILSILVSTIALFIYKKSLSAQQNQIVTNSGK